MTEKDTKNTEAHDNTMCDKCGHKYPGDYPHNDESEIPQAIQRNKTSKFLIILGLVAIIEGFLCVVAAYLDQTWGVLPTDPLTILGVASILAGCLLTMGSFLTYSLRKNRGKDLSTSSQRLLMDQVPGSKSMSIASSGNEREDTIENREIHTDNKKDR